MSALRPHIRAARSYARAWMEVASTASQLQNGENGVLIGALAIIQSLAHERAADIMEAELLADIREGQPAPEGGWPDREEP